MRPYYLNIRVCDETFQKLKQSLTCPICLNIFVEPVYIKDCSHRFCKGCIEKYIRSQERKSCPQCRKKIGTKRQLRLDENIMFMIEAVFGDVHQYIKDEEKYMVGELERLYSQLPLKSQKSSKKVDETTNPKIHRKKVQLQSATVVSEREQIERQISDPLLERQVTEPESPETTTDIDNFNRIKQLVDANIPITITVKLQYLPSCFWVKQVEENVIRGPCTIFFYKIQGSIKLKDLQKVICKKLQLEISDAQYIRFYIMQNDEYLYQQLDTTLQYLNETYWHHYQDLELYDIQDILKRLDDKSQQIPVGDQRQLFYELFDEIFI